MFSQLIHNLSFTLFLFFCLVPGLSLSTRFASLLPIFGVLILCSFLIKVDKNPISLKHWLQSTAFPARYWPLLFSSLLTTCICYWDLPETGLEMKYLTSGSDLWQQTIFPLENFDLPPARLPRLVSSSDLEAFQIQGWFVTMEPLRALLFFANSGHTKWWLDGRLMGEIQAQDVTRIVFTYMEVRPGIHEILCRGDSFPLMPTLSLATASGTEQDLHPLPGPFYTEKVMDSIAYLPLRRALPCFFAVLTFFLIIPILNRILEKPIDLVKRHSRLFQGVALACFIFWILWSRFSLFHGPAMTFEADEAAFGLMAQNLAYGESPPLFHYGQTYQGTLESLPLAVALNHFSSPGLALRILPALWYFAFLVLSVLAFWWFGSFSLALFALGLFAVGGLHFDWIFSKAWFGYGFAMAIGSGLWFLTFLIYHRRFLGPGILLLWGILSGCAFYELPLALPFIVWTGLAIIFLTLKADISHWRANRFSFVSLLHSKTRFLVLSTLLFSAPYWIYPLLHHDFGVFSFLFKGRVLPSLQATGEHLFLNRFLNECLPVLSGVRLPYDQQNNPTTLFFPALPPLVWIFSLLAFPFIARRSFPASSLFSSRFFITCLFLFSLFTIAIGTLSPFGVWPWYFLPLYWILPVFLFVFSKNLLARSPALCLTASLFFLYPIVSAKSLSGPLLYEPSSLAAFGLALPTDFSTIQEQLRRHHVSFALADQGYDFSINELGKDWVGECLTYATDQQVDAIDRLSRRLPILAQQLMSAHRVGYVFHKSYYYNMPIQGKDQDYLPLSLENLDRLFGNAFLGYLRLDADPYILFVPPEKSQPSAKSDWSLSASYPIFLSAMNDHNISVRAFGRETYWSSDTIPKEGVWLSIRLPAPENVQRIVLFHGVKAKDYPKNNRVVGIDREGRDLELGSLAYFAEARASKLDLAQPLEVKEIKIFVSPAGPSDWLTIYELWIL